MSKSNVINDSTFEIAQNQKCMSIFQMEAEAAQSMANNPAETPVAPTEKPIEQQAPNAEQTQNQNPNPDAPNADSGSDGSEGQESAEAPKGEQNQKSLEDFLKESGLTEDDFKQLKEQKAKEKQEAEKPLNEQKRWASIVSKGITDGKITKEDVLKFEQIANTKDEELVFQEFKKTYQTENSDLDEDELEEEVRAAFDDQYNPRLIKAEAEKIRSEMQGKFNAIETEYQKREAVRDMEKLHNTVFAEAIKPLKEVVEIEGQKIEIEIKPEITMDEVKKALKSEQGAPMLELMFNTFQKDKETSAELFKGFVENLAKQKNYKESIVNATWKKAEEHFKSVYSVGAKAPFQANSQSPVDFGGAVDGTQALIDSLR